MTQSSPYSDYFFRLDGKMKARYCEKIACIRNEDPYLMKKNEFTKDMAQLPTLGYPDIVFYLLHTTSFATFEEVKNYKSLQSYKYFTSGWVMEVEWKTYSEEEIILILGKVRHSYASSKPPLHPWVLIKRNGAVIVAHCTCMAGLAETCSHIGAVLHWVEAAVRVNMSATCTLKENTWLMSTPKENIPFLKLSQINFSTPKKLPKREDQQSQQSSAAANYIQTPTNLEKENFFKEIAKEMKKMPLQCFSV